jgi:hypothetical protein
MAEALALSWLPLAEAFSFSSFFSRALADFWAVVLFCGRG